MCIRDSSVPDQQDVMRHLQLAQHRLHSAWLQQQERRSGQLHQLQQRLARNHPSQVLREQQQRIDELTMRLQRTMRAQLQGLQMKLLQNQTNLQQNSPSRYIEQEQQELNSLKLRLNVAIRSQTTRLRHELSSKAGTLHAVSPLATLGRGYSIFRDLKQQVITDSEEVEVGDSMEAILARGSLKCEVTAINHRKFKNRG